MTRDETLKLLFLIRELYPGKFPEMGKDQLRATAVTWQSVLDDIDFSLAQMALKRHVSLSPFPPAVSEIRESAAALRDPDSGITGDQAWRLVLDAVREYGYARKDKAIASLPAQVRKMAERWFDEIGMTENETLGVIRGQFIKAWETNAARDREMAQLPPAVHGYLAGMAGLMRLSE